MLHTVGAKISLVIHRCINVLDVLFVLFIPFCSILFHPGFTTSYKNLPAENELRSKFSVPPVYDHLQYMLCKGNCASYNQIGAVEFNSDLTPCDTKSFTEHQTFFARVRGSGYETIVVVLP